MVGRATADTVSMLARADCTGGGTPSRPAVGGDQGLPQYPPARGMFQHNKLKRSQILVRADEGANLRLVGHHVEPGEHRV
jgi:hypothetical protein